MFLGTPGQKSCYGDVVKALNAQYGDLDTAAEVLGYSRVPVLQNAIGTYCAGAKG